MDRVENFFGEFAVPRAAYATASCIFAALLIAIVSSEHRTSSESSRAELAELKPSAERIELWNHLPELPPPGVQQRVYTASETPRYVLDVRPVSYEGSFSF